MMNARNLSGKERWGRTPWQKEQHEEGHGSMDAHCVFREISGSKMWDSGPRREIRLGRKAWRGNENNLDFTL